MNPSQRLSPRCSGVAFVSSLAHSARLFLAALCAGLSLMPAVVRAFEGWEHEAVGTMSLIVGSNHVARHFASQPQLAERLRTLRETTAEFGRGFRSGTNQTDITFGTIVKLVDYMRDPYDMTHQTSAGAGWPSNSASCNLSYLKRIAGDKIGYLSASHANQNHFQGRAVFAFWNWHQQAVRLAKDGNLWGGLLLEAYANHFLEDLFALGHILAPRDDNAHDVYTLALHDLYNARGLDYVVGAPPQLKALVDSTEALVRAGTLTIPPVPVGRDRQRLHLRLEPMQAFSQSLLSTSASVRCHGDNLLLKNPAQLPLVITYCARAVADVMESYLQAAEINSFNDYRWRSKVFPMRLRSPDVEGIDFQLGFGLLSCLDNPRTIDRRALRAWRSLDVAGPDAKDHDWFPVTETLHRDGYGNPVIGVGVGVQAVATQSGTHMRALFEAETIVYGKRFDFPRQDWEVPEWLPGQLVVTLGYSGVMGSGEQAHGAFVRGIVPLPRLDLNLSVMAGVRYHSRREYNGWGDFEKIRLEWGMQMISLFGGFGHERVATPRGNLAHGLAVEAGMSFGGPVSSFRRLVPSFD